MGSGSMASENVSCFALGCQQRQLILVALQSSINVTTALSRKRTRGRSSRRTTMMLRTDGVALGRQTQPCVSQNSPNYSQIAIAHCLRFMLFPSSSACTSLSSSPTRSG